MAVVKVGGGGGNAATMDATGSHCKFEIKFVIRITHTESQLTQ